MTVGDAVAGAEDPPGLPHERTALAWERTAIALMVAGIALTRSLSAHGHPVLGVVGAVWVLGGGALMWWAATNHQLLHDPTLPADVVPQTGLTRVVGLAVLTLAAFAFATSFAFVLF